MWTAHDNTPQQFLGFLIADIHYKTQQGVLQVKFYVIKDTTCPKILSYATSERLGIVRHCSNFPTKLLLTALDTITSSSKHVPCRTPIQTDRPVKSSNNQQQTLKPAIKTHRLQDITATTHHHMTICHTSYPHFRTICPQTHHYRPTRCPSFPLHQTISPQLMSVI